MKKLLITAVCLLSALVMFAQDPPKKSNKQATKDIVDGLYGAKGRCQKSDGSSGKWYPTKMSETKSQSSSQSSSYGNSSSTSSSASFEAGTTGVKGGLSGSMSSGNNRSKTNSNTDGNSVTYEYECR